MWRTVVVDSEKYLLKYTLLNDVHHLYLTDVVNLWSEELSSHDLTKRCKDLNPLIEADKETLIGYVTSLIDGSTQHIANISLTRDGIKRFDMKSKVAEVPFYFSFDMKKCTADMLCQEVTMPLVKLALQLQTEQNYLCKALEEKDAEIEQYKLEGAVLRKKKLETKLFTQDELLQVKANLPQSADQQLANFFSPWLCARLSTSERKLTGADCDVPLAANSSTDKQPVEQCTTTVKREPSCEPDLEPQPSLLSEIAAKKLKPTTQKKPKLRI